MVGIGEDVIGSIMMLSWLLYTADGSDNTCDYYNILRSSSLLSLLSAERVGRGRRLAERGWSGRGHQLIVHIISRLWPPAAATSRARLALSCPLMSFRSTSGAQGSRTFGCGRASTCAPRKWLAS